MAAIFFSQCFGNKINVDISTKNFAADRYWSTGGIYGIL